MATLTHFHTTTRQKLNFKNRILKNPQGQIKYQIFTRGGRPHYHIELLLLEPPDILNEYKRVEYRLHSISLHPFRIATDETDKFRITFWTWSMFPIHIRAICKHGGLKRCVHPLKYHLPPDNGFNYIEVDQKQRE